MRFRVIECVPVSSFFFFQAEDGIRDLVRSRGLGDVYKRQFPNNLEIAMPSDESLFAVPVPCKLI